jgi:hypothetical protein
MNTHDSVPIKLYLQRQERTNVAYRKWFDKPCPIGNEREGILLKLSISHLCGVP